MEITLSFSFYLLLLYNLHTNQAIYILSLSFSFLLLLLFNYIFFFTCKASPYLKFMWLSFHHLG